MKTSLVATALVGSVTAHIPAAHLARRGVFDSIRPDVIDVLPEGCRTAAQAVVSALPTEPPIFAAFSSRYYEVESRTATVTYEDCAWISELPEPAQTAFFEYANQLATSYIDPDLTEDLLEECGTALGEASASAPCSEEWTDFTFKAMEGFGLDPESLTPDGPSTTTTSESPSTSASGSPETTESSESPEPTEIPDTPGNSAASTVAVQTYAVAALLAAFVGTVALV